MKRTVWLLALGVVVALGLFLIYRHIEQEAATLAEKQRVEEETRVAVTTLASRYNAVVDWEERLSKGQPVRMSSILTMELERLWLSDRPILFIGTIKDISSDSAADYTLVVEQGLFTDYVFQSTELRLSLRAPKASIDSFLQEHPGLLTEGMLANGIAVVASVTKISTQDERLPEGDRVGIKTGYGELLGLVHTGSVFYRPDLKPVLADRRNTPDLD
jgi:hypothetical protein